MNTDGNRFSVSRGASKSKFLSGNSVSLRAKRRDGRDSGEFFCGFSKVRLGICVPIRQIKVASTFRYLFLASGIFVAIVLLGLLVGCSDNSSTNSASNTAWQNWYRARHVVSEILTRQGLKPPSHKSSTDDELEAYSDYQANGGATELGNGVWDAWGTVNGQNVFGAQVRLSWRMVFILRPVEILYVKIGDSVQGNYYEALERAKGASPSRN